MCARKIIVGLLIAVAAGRLVGADYAVQPPSITPPHADDEILLVDALRDIRAARVDSAMTRLETLLARNPDFRSAHMVYADLLLAKARPLDMPGAIVDPLHLESFTGLREELQTRYRHHARHPTLLPRELLLTSAQQRHVVAVDLSLARLYLFRTDSDRPRLIADYYAGAGRGGAFKKVEGDQRTPVGVYNVVGRIPGEELPDLYGSGALPLDYPNTWDRRLGHTGYGIWLHGVPRNTYARAPQTSDGCITLANDDFEELSALIDIDATPVIIAETIEWREPRALTRTAAELAVAIETWRRDWESRNMARYGRHYSNAFESGSHNHQTWLARKERVNGAKAFIRISLSDLSLFEYPGETDLVIATFAQSYESDRFGSETTKRQYWRREGDGVWRIVFEGPA